MTAYTDLPPTQVIETAEAAWGTPLQPAGCDQCGQAHLVEAALLNQPCPNCGRGRLAPQPARLRSEPPELLLSFQKSAADLRTILTGFVQPVRLRPDDFNVETLLQRARPVFWPMWLVDGEIRGDWQAEVGYDYQVKSSQEAYGNGGWRTREVVETRIRWEPRVGQIRRRYENISAPAASDQQRLLDRTGSYPLEQATPYRPEQLRALDQTAALRVPDLQPESAWPMAQAKLKQAAGDDCRKAAGGQHGRNFVLRAEYDSLHWTQLLLPVYFTYYTDDAGQAHSVYINGRTGQAGGVRLASQRKGWRWAGILAGIAAVVFLLTLLCFALAVLLPPLAVLGSFLGIMAFALAVAAILPAVYPWQWNRSQQESSF